MGSPRCWAFHPIMGFLISSAGAGVILGRLPCASSSAAFRIASAAVFSSRGTHVHTTPKGASFCALIASGFMSGCLIFQRPAICSMTSLESIRTSMSSASGVCSCRSSRPAINPRYSATLLLATPIASARSAMIFPESASRISEPYAAGPGLPRDPPSVSMMTRTITAPIRGSGPGFCRTRGTAGLRHRHARRSHADRCH